MPTNELKSHFDVYMNKFARTMYIHVNIKQNEYVFHSHLVNCLVRDETLDYLIFWIIRSKRRES